MGVMEKMRSSTTVILWILILSFGLLWVLADTKVFNVINAGPSSLGQVNGTPISIQEYNKLINYYTEQYSQQTGNSVTPEMRAYYEDQAWNELVTQKLLKDKMNELGITVTDAELVDMITGENPDPFIRRQFQKKDGTIDRVALKSAIEAPENTKLWIMIEQQLRQKRRQQKMNNFVQSSLQVSDYEINQAYIQNNSFADIQYVRFPYASITDSMLNITDSDLRDYYDEHKDRYKRKETYRFNYVSFDKTPTKADTARTINELKRIKSDFASAQDDSVFMARYQSATPYSDSYVNKSDVRKEFKPVFDLKDGQVSDVIMINGRAHLLKKLDEKRDKVKFLDLSMDVKADPIETVDKRAEAADDFSFYAEEEGFKKEAERRKLEIRDAFATKDNPFVAGIGQSRQIMQFLNGADEGKVSKPIELDNQFVVLKVTEIQPEGYRPFDEVKAQIETAVRNDKRKNMTLDRAQKLASSQNTLDALAQAAGSEVKTADNVRMSATVIAGAGREPEIVGAVFGLKQGETSKPLPGNNAAFVIKVNKMQKADPASMDATTRSQLKAQIKREKVGTFMRVWMDQLKKEADISDYRSELIQR